jgi:hypothetical protein
MRSVPIAWLPRLRLTHECSYALMACSVVLAAAIIGWWASPPIVLDVGGPHDTLYLRTGFYEREDLELGASRWTGPDARLVLPHVPGSATIELRTAGRPGGVEVALDINGHNLGTLELPDDQVRNYTVLLPPRTWRDLGIRLTLSAPSSTQPVSADDPRRLTALVERVTLHPGSAAFLPLAAILLVLCTLTGGVGMRLVQMPPAWAWLIAGAAGTALAAGWGWNRLYVAPFLPFTLLGGALILALLTAIKSGVNRAGSARAWVVLGALALAAGPVALHTLLADYGWDLFRYENLPLLLPPLGLALLWHPTPATRRVLAGAILLIAGGFAFGMLMGVIRSDYGHDFHAIYEGVAEYAKAGAPLYNLAAIAANPLDALYKYPPSFALIFWPFAQPDFVPALYAWRFVNGILLIIAVWALLRAYNMRLRSWPGAGLLLTLFLFRSIPDTLRYGQIDSIVFCALALGLLAVRRERWGWMGAAIGVAAAIKLYPAYLLGLPLIRRRWPGLAGATFAGGAIGLASLAFFGWEVWFTFLRDVLGSTGVGTAWADNQTFNGFLNRLPTADSIGLVPDGGGWLRVATYVWFAAFTGLTVYLTRPGAMRADLAYGVWITALLIVLPVAWMHYIAILVIPIFQLLVLADERKGGLPWPALACLALAFMLIAQGNVWTFFDRNLYGPYWQLILSYKFYGMLLLYAAMWRAWDVGRGRV